MISRIIVRPAAELEMREAHDWYEARERGLGAEFLRCLEGCIEGMRRQPQMYPAVHKEIRQGVLRRFPYSVFYLAAEDAVIVTAVFHASRNPGIWKRRG